MSSILDVNSDATLTQTQSLPTPDSIASSAPSKRTPGDASRENGKKSHGPITAAGKQNSSRNASKHMLSAKYWAYSNQNLPGINKIQRALRAEFQPTTPAETALVQDMALARWQIQSSAEEIAALVDYTRDQFFNDPSRSPRANSALATDKLNKESTTLANYQRNQRDAQRRFVRAVHELVYIRQHTDILHSGASCLPKDRLEELAQIDSTPEIPQNQIQHNEPEHLTENIQPAPESKTDNLPVYGDFEPPPTANPTQPPAQSTGAIEYSDRVDSRTIIHAINRELINFPDAHHAIAVAVDKLEDEREARNAEFLRRRRQ